jgi:hypothetical protein
MTRTPIDRPALTRLLVLAACCACSGPAAAASLEAGGLSSAHAVSVKADIGQVNGLLRRAESNLSSVTQSMGDRTTPPRGSAGKLLARRLEQVNDDLKPAKELLDAIPAGTDGREEAAARYATAAAEYNRLVTIFNGGNAPPPEDKSDTVKLDYRQQETLSNARFHTREVRGNATLLTERTMAMKEIADQLTINYRDVIELRSVVENAVRKTGYARDALSKLPENGAGVAPVRQDLVNADAEVMIARDYLNPLHAKLQDLINPANYPEFNADRDRLRELGRMFAQSGALKVDRAFAGETFQQAQASRDECIRIARKYLRLIQQQTGQGVELDAVGNHFLQKHAEFLAAAEEEKASLPAEIRGNLEQARTYAREAVAEQKPGWFNGGIPQVMGFAEEGVALLEILDKASGAEMRKAFADTKAELKKASDALREQIIRENTMPADNYEGSDREKVIEVAKSGWRVQQKEFDLLKVRMPMESWRRETKWTYSNGTWYFSDRSRIQVRLLVADHENDELAIDRVMTVWKNHQSGDTMIATPFRSFDEELEPSSYLLRSKIK